MGRSTYIVEFGVQPGGMRMGLADALTDLDAVRSSIQLFFSSIRGRGRPQNRNDDDDNLDNNLDLVEYGFHAYLWQVHRGRPVKVTNLCHLVHIQWGQTRLTLDTLFTLKTLGRGPSMAPEPWDGKEVSVDVPWVAIEKEIVPLDGKLLEMGQSVSLSLDSLPVGFKVPTDTHLGEGDAIFFGPNDLENGLDEPDINPTAFKLQEALLHAEDQDLFEACATEVLFSARATGNGSFHMICREFGESAFWVRTKGDKKSRWCWSKGDLETVLSTLAVPMRDLATATIDF